MRALKLFVCLLALFALNVDLPAQTPTNDYLSKTGRPDFTVTEPVEGGFLNLANGNLRLEIPMATVPQRGGSAITIKLTYDSKLWTASNSFHRNSWFPSGVHNSSIGGWAVVPSGAPGIAISTCSGIDFSCGTADETVTKGDCQRDGPPQTQTSYLYSSKFIWHSADGSSHPFYLDTYQTFGGSAGTNCPVDLLNNGTWANDGSGFFIAVTNFNDFIVYDNLGNIVGQHNGSLIGSEDANGNSLSYDANGNLIDNLGRTLVVTTVNGNQIYYDILNSQDTRSRYTLTLETIDVNTAFGLSGISEYNGTITTVQRLTFPNGTSYTFGYDSGTAPGNYGLLSSTQLPAGGQVQFGYSNFVDALGGLDRWLTSRASLGNQWSYIPAVTTPWPGTGVDSAQQQVTVNRPNGESRIYSFAVDIDSGSWLTNAVDKDASGNTLKTELREYTPTLGTFGPGIFSCDATNGCNGPPGFGSRLPARLTTSYTTTGGTLSKKTEYSYDSLQNGNVTEVREWDYYSGPAPASPTRIIDVTYAPASGNNIIGKPASLTVKDGSGNPVFQETMEYDNYTNGLSPSGAVQHDSAYGTAYTTRGNLTALKQFRNTDGVWLTTRHQYDDAGNRLSTTDPLMNTTTFDYTDSWATFKGEVGGNVCAPSNGQQTKAFLTTVTDALNHATTNTYYSCTGLLASTTDPNKQTTTFVYDSIGRKFTLSYPDGGQTNFDYHGDTLPLTTTKKVLLTGTVSINTSTILDGLGRVSQTSVDSDPDGVDVVDTTYDTLGRVSTVSNPHRSASSSTDGITTYSYDAVGRVTQVTKQDGSFTTTAYEQPAAVLTNSDCTRTTDEIGNQRQSCTDALERVVEVDEPLADGTLGGGSSGKNPPVSLYQYDLLGNLLRVDQKGSAPNDSTQWRTRTFAYNSLSQLLCAANPEIGGSAVCPNPDNGAYTLGTIRYSYDNDGNLTSKTSPAPNQGGSATQTISYCYDALNRVTGKAYSAQTCTNGQLPIGTAVLSYSYDSGTNGIGHLSLLKDQAGSVSYSSYDAMGRVLSQQRTFTPQRRGDPTVSRTVSYTYDLAGHMTSITYPRGITISYTFNAAGQPVSAADTANNINYVSNGHYTPAGGLAQMQNGAGLASTYIFDHRLQPCWMYTTTATPLDWKGSHCGSTASPASVLDLKYDFHAGAGDNGSVYGITNNRDTTRSQSFTYDSLNRLATAGTTVSTGNNAWGLQYGYDAWGNLLSASVTQGSAGALSVVATTQNQILGFCYDVAGNLLQQAGCPAAPPFTYNYDAENRLSASAGTSYTYDGDGNRVRKSSGTTATLYWYGPGEILDETDRTGTITGEYIFFVGKRVARWTSSGVNYYFADHLGTARIVTDASGTVLDDSDYYPFGGERVSLSSSGNHYKFTGKERDSETGLDYFGARYYSPGLGRFITPDWAAKATAVPYAEFTDPQSLNLYTYVRNVPTTHYDADGHGWNELVQDLKKAASQLTVKASFGLGIGYKGKLAGAHVRAEAAYKGNLQFTTSDGKLAAAMTLEGGASAGISKKHQFGLAGSAEKVLGSVNVGTGERGNPEPITFEWVRGTSHGNTNTAASHEGFAVGQEEGEVALGGGEISISKEGLAALKDAGKQLRELLEPPPAPPPPAPPPPPPPPSEVFPDVPPSNPVTGALRPGI